MSERTFTIVGWVVWVACVIGAAANAYSAFRPDNQFAIVNAFIALFCAFEVATILPLLLERR